MYRIIPPPFPCNSVVLLHCHSPLYRVVQLSNQILILSLPPFLSFSLNDYLHYFRDTYETSLYTVPNRLAERVASATYRVFSRNTTVMRNAIEGRERLVRRIPLDDEVSAGRRLAYIRRRIYFRRWERYFLRLFSALFSYIAGYGDTFARSPGAIAGGGPAIDRRAAPTSSQLNYVPSTSICTPSLH